MIDDQVINERPIMAVLSQPIPDFLPSTPELSNADSYIEASYVRWLQSAGARVVPISHSDSVEHACSLLDQTNGLLLPGGADQPEKYTEFAKKLFEYVLKKNDLGEYYPVMGICLGFEDLAMFRSSASILSRHKSYRQNLKMYFKVEPQNTKLFSQLELEAYVFQDYPLAYQAHSWGISPEDFERHLSDFYVQTTHSLDEDNQPFVATFEAIDYPIYGMQFHPEKAVASFYPGVNIDHSRRSREYNRYFADFFVDEARKNSNKFSDFAIEQRLQIENYKEVLVDHFFDKVYVF